MGLPPRRGGCSVAGAVAGWVAGGSTARAIPVVIINAISVLNMLHL